MKNIQQVRNGKYTFLLFIGMLVLALLLSVGTAYGRYQISTEEELTLQNQTAEDSVYFLNGESGYQAPGTWQYDEITDSFSLYFRLSNSYAQDCYADNDQTVSLAVMSTVADSSLDKQQETSVVLTVGTEQFTGRPAPVIKGSVFWKQYGEGQIYRFYNEAGEELQWTLAGGQLSEIPMRLTVTGSESNTAFTMLMDRIRSQG